MCLLPCLLYLLFSLDLLLLSNRTYLAYFTYLTLPTLYLLYIYSPSTLHLLYFYFMCLLAHELARSPQRFILTSELGRRSVQQRSHTEGARAVLHGLVPRPGLQARHALLRLLPRRSTAS